MKSAVVVGALGGFLLAVAMHDPGRTGGRRAAPARASDGSARARRTAAPPAPVVVPFFGNGRCPLDGRPVDRSAWLQHEGQRAYACSPACRERLAAEPARALELAYPTVRRDSVAACLVCAAPVAADSTAAVTYQGRRVELCGGTCERQFRLVPIVWLTRDRWPDVHDAGNHLCPVDDQPIDGVSIALHRSTLIRLSSPGCAREFEKAPDLMLAKVRREKG